MIKSLALHRERVKRPVGANSARYLPCFAIYLAETAYDGGNSPHVEKLRSLYNCASKTLEQYVDYPPVVGL